MDRKALLIILAGLMIAFLGSILQAVAIFMR